MGVYLSLRSATKEQIDALLANPEFLPYFFGADIEEVEPPRTLWNVITRRKPTLPAALADLSDSMQTDLDKAWHGLHYLLAGTAEGGDWPASFLLDGVPVSDEDGAHAHWPEQLVQCRDFVHSLTEDDLRARYDPKEMTKLGIYPSVIWERDGDEALDYILEQFSRLWAFLRDATAENHGCVIWIA